MAHIPQSVLDQCPPLEGLPPPRRGKVRDIYDLPDDLLLIVTSKRVSAFDFVLPALVEQKDEVLNALNIFWFRFAADRDIKGDIVAYGRQIDAYLPERLRNRRELWKTAVVVRKHNVVPVEEIYRGYITGSMIKAYNKQQAAGTKPINVLGYEMPEGLKDGDRLPKIIFTPTTKAEDGHDEPMPPADVIRDHPRLVEAGRKLYDAAVEYALSRGLLLLDTKFEGDDEGVICDERLTPDSSRYSLVVAYNAARKEGGAPPSLDKQYVRRECIRLGIDKLNPKMPADIERVDSTHFRSDVFKVTTGIYRYIFWKLTGMTLEQFQREVLGISDQPDVKVDLVEIVIGSKSDLDQLEEGLAFLRSVNQSYGVSIISCHRNRFALDRFARNRLSVGRVLRVIAAAGKAAVLPGDLKASLCAQELSHVPVIGVALRGKTDDANLAAKLSIVELPGQPVELRSDGEAYFGSQGFLEACQAAVNNEPLPGQFDLSKEEKLDELVFNGK